MAANYDIPILIVSDAVSSGTGLARIAGDIASNLVKIKSDVEDSTALHYPLFRVATAGVGGPGSRKFPFPQYHLEGMKDFVCPTLPDVWDDWAGKKEGIILWVWDLTRLAWFSQPVQSEALQDFPSLIPWLSKPPFKRWIYAPIDASGPLDRMTFPLMKTLLGFDRVLAYTKFGEDIIRRTIGDEESAKRDLGNIPHGIDSSIFFPMNQRNCRKVFLKTTGAQAITGEEKPIKADEVLIGIVATNQSRKDWALGIETAALIAQKHQVRLWIHTDQWERYWSIPALLVDYGLIHNTVVSLGHITDEKMAQAYSACDLTLGIGPEGFGYPIFESMFCGTPCLHGNYGGAPEYMGEQENSLVLVDPIAFRHEGEYAMRRPIYRASDWAEKAEKLIGARVNRPGELDWEQVWPRWENWFRRGV